jgi:hypothetical protein
MNPYYQFTISFGYTDTTLPTPPEVIMPANVTPVIPPVGATVLFTQADGSLYEGAVQSLAYKIAGDVTQVIITVPAPATSLRKRKSIR